ncbi:FadR/GntR family transcriptional regulator [Fusobacterium ulcerans]|uniref:FadR/GntR family transcriptional regulator n=1 Tax=Fusobacterium ulcerans TaxID=861 RepID=UPI0026EAFCBE|nr:GntR family transcriptional regulator [Fusobacterium ulcerans]
MKENKFMSVSLANKSVVERITDQITNAIINGELKPGDKIPTEVELCESFGVGRNSVREAIKILEAYGVLEIRRADGTYIRQGYDDKMLYPILYGIILQKDSKEQIVELRKVIDVGIFQEAMKRMTKEDFKQLEDELTKMEEKINKEIPSSQEMFEADVKFHAIIVGILDNRLLESIGYYVDKITKSSRIVANEYILDHGHQEDFIALHREIIEMFREKQSAKIHEIVEKHYKYWEK